MRQSRPSIRSGPLKGIRRVRQDGKVYRYHRATGIRLPDDIPETDKRFLAAYLEAENSLEDGLPKRKRHTAPAKHTLAYGLWKFCRDDDFLNLSEGYKDNLHRHFDAITKRAGSVPVAQIRDVHIQADIEDLQRNAARMRLKAWRAPMKFLKRKRKSTKTLRCWLKCRKPESRTSTNLGRLHTSKPSETVGRLTHNNA